MKILKVCKDVMWDFNVAIFIYMNIFICQTVSKHWNAENTADVDIKLCLLKFNRMVITLNLE